MSFKVVGIGEVLWDLLPSGKQLGGAPANFTYHAGALGAEAHIISRIGRDELGDEVLDRVRRLGLAVDTIQVDPSFPTGTVSVTLDQADQPHYTIHENVAWDHLAADENSVRIVRDADAVCFGTLAQRHQTSRKTIRTLLSVARDGDHSLRILDVNLRQQYFSPSMIDESLRLANVLKVNETELPLIAEIFQLAQNHRQCIEQLAERYQLRAVAFTRGGHGSLLYERGSWSDDPGLPVKVADTIGAGDSFTAAMALGLLAGWDLDEINNRANQVAAYVASRSGATPAIPEELLSLFVGIG